MQAGSGQGGRRAEGQGQGRRERRRRDPGREIDKLQRQYADRIPRPPLSVLIDHIDHIAKVAGVDHVGLGSDFDGIRANCPRGSTRPPICPRSPRR
jgi:microsomal dipeptidase-like Zn-dependent dipeptidase